MCPDCGLEWLRQMWRGPHARRGQVGVDGEIGEGCGHALRHQVGQPGVAQQP